MKHIKINTLKIENFKGVEKKEFKFDNKSVSIYGTNETGKTTLVDAFMWCLFGKDSLGNTNFQIKPVDKITKREIHNLLTSVEVGLTIDGINQTFKRSYEEVYKTTRGKAEQEFAGHTSNYYINEVPSKAGDFTNAIKEIIDEELFRSLTNVNYFTSKHWKDQRKIIFSLAKDITDNDILLANPELEKLQKLVELTNRTVSDNHLIYISQNKAINKDLKDLPVAIRTLNKKEYDIPSTITEQEILEQIKVKQEEIKNLNEEKNSPDNNQEVVKIKNEINTLKINLSEIEKEHLGKQRTQKEERNILEDNLIKEIREKTLKYQEANNNILFNNNKIKTLKTNEELLLNEREELRNKYDEVAGRTFTGDVCSYCKQPLPQDKLTELKAEFNIHTSTKLEEIRNKGKAINLKLEQFESSYKECNENIVELNNEIKNINNFIIKTREELTELQNKPFEELKTAKNIETVKGWIKEKETELLNVNGVVDTSKVDNKINDLNNGIDKLREQQTLLNEKIKNQNEIKEYEDELRKHQTQYEVNLQIIALCEQFVAIKSSMLEKTINANFEMVEFKLFNELINGGIEETCEATVNGVPYASVNNAGKINAGLDIINALQTIYEVSAPIFIDNAEAVVMFLENDAQLIKLYVSEQDKELRIEKEK